MKKEADKQNNSKNNKALSISLKEGAITSIQSNIDATYIPQYTLALNGTSFHVGILSAISGLLNPLASLLGDKLMESKKRKKIVLFSAILQILLFAGIAALGYLMYHNYFKQYLIYALIILYSLLWFIAGIGYPAWFSWIGDLTEKIERGKYFGRRNKILTLVGILLIPVGFILDYFETKGILLLAFSALFLIASLTRTISVYLLIKQYEPKFKLKKNYYFSMFDFLKRFDDVGKFAVYYALFTLVLMLASPFFAVYMREKLQFNYLEITLISLTSSIFYMIFSPLAGKISDKYGNVILLYLGCILLSLNPLLWIFLKDPISLSLIPQLIVGASNAALAISATNYIFNMSSKDRRALCISYMNILYGIGVFIGSLLGGIMLTIMPAYFANPFMIVFAISSLLRFAVSIFFIKRLKETEDRVKKFPKAKISLIHPLRTIHSEINLLRKIAH